jgi:hypothetical protein
VTGDGPERVRGTSPPRAGRLALALVVAVAATACKNVSYGDDGNWSRLDAPCAPIGGPVTLLRTPDLFGYAAAGGTLVYGTSTGIQQLSLDGGETRTVALVDEAYHGPIGVTGNSLVYYEELVIEHSPHYHGLFVDHGVRSDGERWERISGADAATVADAVALDHGVLWSELSASGVWHHRSWDPERRAGSFPWFDNRFVTNGRQLLYVNTGGELVLQDLDGERTVVPTSSGASPLLLADDGVAYYGLSSGDIAMWSRGAAERVITTGVLASEAVLIGDRLYVTSGYDILGIQPSGDVELVYAVQDGRMGALATDGCNLFWRENGDVLGLRLLGISPP